MTRRKYNARQNNLHYYEHMREYKKAESGGRCAICGGLFEYLEIDHIKPRAAGGPDTLDNLQPLCKQCHAQKTAKEARAVFLNVIDLINKNKKT